MNNQDILQLFESVATEEGIRNHKVEEGKSGMKGDGYLGVVREMVLLGKDDENKNKSLNLIVKKASNSDMLRNQAPLENLYEREIYMYNNVFPEFKQLEIEKGFAPTMIAPKFYKGNMTYKNEVLILENLKESGFKLYDRTKPMNADHLSLVVTAYGRYHALSFALRDQQLNKFNTTITAMADVYIDFLKKSMFLETLKYLATKAQETLNANTDKEIIKVYENFTSGIEPFIDELVKSPDDFSVAMHGDCWTNNMLFKYEDGDDATKPTKVCFIDFQLSGIGPPVLDLAYFLGVCSSKDSLDNMDYYLNLYYNSLSSYLLKLGSDPEKLYPYSIFKQQWTRYARYGLIMAASVIHVALGGQEEVVDLADVAESGVAVKDAFNYKLSKADEYSKRMRDLITHYVKHNLI